MHLTPEELHTFDLHGFCVVRGALAPDRIERIATRLGDLEGLDRDELPPQALPVWTPVVDEYKILNIVECDGVFRELIDDPQLLRWAEALVPGPKRLTQAFSITRRRGVGLPLHAIPVSNYSAEGGRPRTDFLTISIALTATGAEDGPFVAFEGSHKSKVPFPYGLVHPDWSSPPSDPGWVERALAAEDGRRRMRWEEIPGYREVHVEPGDAIVFTEDLMHGAKEHRSDRTRRTLYYSYSPRHYPNWHGAKYSEELRGEVSDRARQLLAGPYLGSLIDGSESEGIEPDDQIPRMPQSARDRDRFRRPSDDERAPRRPGDPAPIDP